MLWGPLQLYVFSLNLFYNESLYCYVPTQIPYLGKIFFLRYRPIALNQSDSRIFKSTISPELIDKTASFFAYLYKLSKIKSLLKFFWLGMVINGCGQLSLGTLGTLIFGWVWSKMAMTLYFMEP